MPGLSNDRLRPALARRIVTTMLNVKGLRTGFLVALLVPGFLQGQEPAIVVAGRQASIEEAVASPHARDYRLLILRDELNRVRASRAEEEVRELLERARRGGAVVFVCERDLKAERMDPVDLLPGIVTADASRAWENGPPSSADIRLRALCS